MCKFHKYKTFYNIKKMFYIYENNNFLENYFDTKCKINYSVTHVNNNTLQKYNIFLRNYNLNVEQEISDVLLLCLQNILLNNRVIININETKLDDKNKEIIYNLKNLNLLCDHAKYLENSEIPCFNLRYEKISVDFILMDYLIKKFGIIILKKYFSNNNLKKIKMEATKFEKKLNTNETKLTEGCSGDFRLFHIEKKSKLFKNLISDNKLFNDMAALYKDKKYFNKKLLLNKVVFNKNNKTSSGGGWHRDNHHCQFKTLVYMSDVELENGNFQFIVNSTIKDIGIPPHWSYNNTRYSDDTIDKLLKNNTNSCKMYDIIGEAGTVVFFVPTNIHRGKVIEKGSRTALTQYYFT